MTGNFGLILAGDIPTFYTAFALMAWPRRDWSFIVATRKPRAPVESTWRWRW